MHCSEEFLSASAVPGRSSSAKTRWTKCCAEARSGQWPAATESRKISSALKKVEMHPTRCPSAFSHQAKKRQAHEMGTLGSGNHYLEVQRVAEIFDSWTASVLGCRKTTLSSAFTADQGVLATRWERTI